MVQYVAPADLASYLQKDLDTATATLVIEKASAMFAREADTAFESISTTWTTTATGSCYLDLPFRPVTAVSTVRVNGITITGWVLRSGSLYRLAGFGWWGMFPPEEVQVDLTYGYATVPDDVKAAVLEIAGQAYDVPLGVVASEQIDDYAVRYVTTGGGLQMTGYARDLAAGYRGLLIT